MRIFTRIHNWPELCCLSDSERKRLYRESERQARKERYRHWQWWWAVGVYLLFTFPMLLAASNEFLGWPHMSPEVSKYCTVSVIIPSFFCWVPIMIGHRCHLSYLRKTILKRYHGRPPSCFACGYDLRYCENFDRSGCPECGWRPEIEMLPDSVDEA